MQERLKKRKIEFIKVDSFLETKWPDMFQWFENNPYTTVADVEEMGQFDILCYKVPYFSAMGNKEFYFVEIDARYEHLLLSDDLEFFICTVGC